MDVENRQSSAGLSVPKSFPQCDFKNEAEPKKINLTSLLITCSPWEKASWSPSCININDCKRKQHTAFRIQDCTFLCVGVWRAQTAPKTWLHSKSPEGYFDDEDKQSLVGWRHSPNAAINPPLNA